MTAREDVSFTSDGTTCAAWLYRPDGPGPHPVVVMGHGIGGTRELRLDAFAERFAAAGYACLVFDYRHFGASEGEPRQLLSTRRQRTDWHAAIAWARRHPDLDPDRVVLWGTSYGGGHVIAVGAHDGRVAAVVAQCPFTSGVASTLVVPTLTSVRLTLRALRDVVGSWLGRPPVPVELAGRPGQVALMSAPDVEAGFAALQPPGWSGDTHVAARFALDIVRQRPGARARRLRAPLHVVVCDRDTVAPPRPTARLVARAADVEVRHHDAGHFDVYVGQDFEDVVVEQTDFLHRRVPITA